MIDYAFKFTDEAAAIAAAQSLNPQLSGALYRSSGNSPASGNWSLDHVLPNVKVWRPSQDTTQMVPVHFPGNSPDVTQDVPMVVHNYLSGWFAIVSIDTPAPIPVLMNAPQLQFALNRTARMAGQPFLIQNNIGAIITDIDYQPKFLMDNPYPVGGFN